MVLVFSKNKKNTLPWNNGNRHEKMKEYQTRIGLLCDIAEEASSITHVSTLLERILKVTQNTIDSAITAVFLKDNSKARVHLPITVSQYDDAIRRQATVIESEIADMVAGNMNPVIINNVAADPRVSLESKKASDSIVKSIIAAPILKGERVIGVLMGVNKDNDGDFTQQDFEVLRGFATTEAIILLVSLEKTAIENVRSLDLTQDLVEGYRDTVHELASTIDVKDDRVYDHSRRVKEYALLAANSLTLTPKELQTIEFGALLHDIGKIGVDSEILRKPGPLTDEEWQIVYEHPQKGANILEDIPHLKDAINIVLYHHERYDGTGYPKKLKGDEIPIGARLVAVANAFDTMTTNHPYRTALSVDEAMRELLDATGTQFCPKAIEAFVAAYKKHSSNLPVKENPAVTKMREVKLTNVSSLKEDKDTTNNLLVKVRKEAEEVKNLKEKAEKEAKEAKIRADKEAQEAKIKAEKEAKEARIQAKQEAEEAKEAKIRTEKEIKIKAEKKAKEAKIKAEKKAKIKPEKETKEAKTAAVQETKEAKEVKVKAEKEAKIKAEKVVKEAKKVPQEWKATSSKIDSEVFKGNIRLVVPIAVPTETAKRFGGYMEKIEGVEILMLSHSEEEGHQFLLGLVKPIALIRLIKEIPMVENVKKKGGVFIVDLRDELII